MVSLRSIAQAFMVHLEELHWVGGLPQLSELDDFISELDDFISEISVSVLQADQDESLSMEMSKRILAEATSQMKSRKFMGPNGSSRAV
ncbi:hypothetical protein NDU88_001668 [Pleurodeles waltl]|uniref:Uncharacterized protein n=1 Tax=Pleurodeles waltl TaxID=8319 RepID=A0AAV7LA79_PLEWA|nr:hypothetical protein NDU88_001668 [Pleurodeles waltl]